MTRSLLTDNGDDLAFLNFLIGVCPPEHPGTFNLTFSGGAMVLPTTPFSPITTNSTSSSLPLPSGSDVRVLILSPF